MGAHEERFSLAGKVALVTDMASPLGQAIAEALVRAGAHVHGVNADHDQCVAQVNALRRWGGASGHAVDLRNGMAALRLARLLNEELPRLHLVVSTSRIAAAVPAATFIPETSSETAELLGELAFVQELLEVLKTGASAEDRARVVLVGQFSEAMNRQSLERQAKESAARLASHHVDLNLIDLRSPPTSAQTPSILLVVAALKGYLQGRGVSATAVR